MDSSYTSIDKRSGQKKQGASKSPNKQSQSRSPNKSKNSRSPQNRDQSDVVPGHRTGTFADSDLQPSPNSRPSKSKSKSPSSNQQSRAGYQPGKRMPNFANQAQERSVSTMEGNTSPLQKKKQKNRLGQSDKVDMGRYQTANSKKPSSRSPQGNSSCNRMKSPLAQSDRPFNDKAPSFPGVASSQKKSLMATAKSTAKVSVRCLISEKFGDNYYFGPELGKGAQGVVYQFKRENLLYAAKATPNNWVFAEVKGFPDHWRRRMKAMAREALFLEIIDSPYVIKFIEFVRTQSNFYLIQEFANGGTLTNLLKVHGGRFTEPIAKKVMHQLIQGCQALNEVGIMHRDLKLDNILVHFPNVKGDGVADQVSKSQIQKMDCETEEFLIKIADLGYAREIEYEKENKKRNMNTTNLSMIKRNDTNVQNISVVKLPEHSKSVQSSDLRGVTEVTDMSALTQEVEEVGDEPELEFVQEVNAYEVAAEVKKSKNVQSFCGSPMMMPFEQLQRRWGVGGGYNHKIDVWALGIIFFHLLTGMYVFRASRAKDYSAAMKELCYNIKKGEWEWPKNIEISIQGFHLLNRTLEFNPAKRPSWQEILDHQYFTSTQSEMVPLQVVFDEEPESGLQFAGEGRILLNTKNPDLYQNLYEEALRKQYDELKDKMVEHEEDILRISSSNSVLAQQFQDVEDELTGQATFGSVQPLPETVNTLQQTQKRMAVPPKPKKITPNDARLSRSLQAFPQQTNIHEQSSMQPQFQTQLTRTTDHSANKNEQLSLAESKKIFVQQMKQEKPADVLQQRIKELEKDDYDHTRPVTTQFDEDWENSPKNKNKPSLYEKQDGALLKLENQKKPREEEAFKHTHTVDGKKEVCFKSSCVSQSGNANNTTCRDKCIIF